MTSMILLLTDETASALIVVAFCIKLTYVYSSSSWIFRSSMARSLLFLDLSEHLSFWMRFEERCKYLYYGSDTIWLLTIDDELSLPFDSGFSLPITSIVATWTVGAFEFEKTDDLFADLYPGLIV